MDYFNKFQGIFTRDNEVFFMNDYLGIKRSIKSQIKLFQFPNYGEKLNHQI